MAHTPESLRGLIAIDRFACWIGTASLSLAHEKVPGRYLTMCDRLHVTKRSLQVRFLAGDIVWSHPRRRCQ